MCAPAGPPVTRALADPKIDERPAQEGGGIGTLIGRTAWLTAILLPAYTPELNPVEEVWPQHKGNLADLTAKTIGRLASLVRNRLKSLRYRPTTLDGFMAETGLSPP